MQIEKIKKRPIIRPLDICVIILIIVIAIIAIAIVKQPKGIFVEISYNGEIIYRVPLNKDRIINIENTGKVIIENNTVRLIKATCPDKLCEMQGCISKAGESIICLPNKLIITILGDSEWDIIV